MFNLGLKLTNNMINGKKIIKININNFITINAQSPLQIPSYTQNDSNEDQVLHPSVLYFENGWNGYKYWMAYTPYPNNNIKKQNPSIVVSNDKINWVVPPGLTNPIIAEPSAEIQYPFNSDPQLTMSADGETMYCIYRIVTNWNRQEFWKIETTDGVNWHNNVQVLSFIKPKEALSPAIVYKDGLYHMWYNGGGNPRKYYYRTSTNLIDWGDEYLTNISSINIQDTYKYFWHIDVVYNNGYYWIIGNMAKIGDYAGDLYIGYSKNGIDDWVLSNEPILIQRNSYWDRALYRPTILPTSNTSFDLWYSTVHAGLQSGKIAYTQINYNA